MFLTLVLFFVATFAMVAAAVVGYRFLVERKSLAGEDPDSKGVEWMEPGGLLKSDSLSTISLWDRLLERFDCFEIMRQRLAEAGLGWSVGRLTALMLLTGTIILAVPVAMHWSWAGGGRALAAALLASVLPYAYVLHLRRKRLDKFESQFADAMDSLARAMRAGNALSAGLDILALEAAQPLAGEMRLTAQERRYGNSWDDALDNLAKRVPLVEVSVFVAAVKLQNRSGGNLGEMLGRMSEAMRERYALKSEISSIAAHGRLTGTILTILPIGIAVMMQVVNPEYLNNLWSNQTGRELVFAAGVALLAAHLVIKRMVQIRI